MRQEPRGRAGYRSTPAESWRYSTAIVAASTASAVATSWESGPWWTAARPRDRARCREMQRMACPAKIETSPGSSGP